MLKKQNLAKYRSLLALESHWNFRKGTPTEKRVDEEVVKLLIPYHLHDLAERDLLQKICGIFDTNSFDLTASDAQVDVAGVFPESAMMMHSCIKNTRITLG